MIAETVIGVGAVAAGGYAYARTKRTRLYRELSGRVTQISATQPLRFSPSPQADAQSFADRLATFRDFLPQDLLAKLNSEAERLAGAERSFVPAHKKGGTIAYETLIAKAPAIVAFYHSRDMRGFVSRLVGTEVKPTPLADQSSLSVLVYDRPGDHIGWHYDHNFYLGRHFTVLIGLHNRGSAEGGLSHAMLKARLPGGEIDIATPVNAIVVFEGARVVHKVTPIVEGERRMMLSMTYCTDPRARWWQGVSRRIKDTAFYGVRALWT